MSIFLFCSTCWVHVRNFWNRGYSWSSATSDWLSQTAQWSQLKLLCFCFAAFGILWNKLSLNVWLNWNWVQFCFTEENQKKYVENDERIKSSPLMKELLEKSKLNKEKYFFFDYVFICIVKTLGYCHGL